MKIVLQCIIQNAFRKILILSIIFMLPTILSAKSSPNDSILAVLNMEIDRSQEYYTKKEKKIENLHRQLSKQPDKRKQLDIVNTLFDEYYTWQNDSAFVYVRLSKQLATELNNEFLKIKSQLNLLRCFISSGYYKEGFELIESMNLDNMPVNLKGEYYRLAMEYYDALMIYYNDDYYTQIYTSKALEYFEKAKNYYAPETAEYAELDAYAYRLTNATPKEKIEKYHTMLNLYNYSESDLAYYYILMSVQYIADNNREKAIFYSALSAICDIRSAIRQTTSKTILGELLYQDEEVLFASKCIKSSLDDANFYNAHQRMAQLNSILPIVEYDKNEIIEYQKDRLSIYLLLMGILFVAVVIALLVIYKQIKRLTKARKSIQQQYQKISDINKKLENTNIHLTDSNHLLEEANDIKDAYIIQSLYGKSEYIERTEQLLKKVDRMVTTRQFENLKSIDKEFNSKEERENMYSSFDTTFLMLFPNFIEEYNSLFKEEDRIVLVDNNLTPELRIFALIRLGISDNERIARFLNVSVKTVYTYKYKVKNKTLIPKEEFEYRIMRIERKRRE